MKNTKRKHLKLCLLLLFMVLGCFAITNVRTTTVQASSRTFKSNGRTYMEKHNDNTLNTVLYQKVSGRYKQVASIPLSLTAYMKVTSFNPVVYEVCYMDKERKQRTVEEEKLRKEAVQELLIYQG